MNRLKEKYTKEIIPSLQSKYQYKSVMEVPKLEKSLLISELVMPHTILNY